MRKGVSEDSCSKVLKQRLKERLKKFRLELRLPYEEERTDSNPELFITLDSPQLHNRFSRDSPNK